MEGNKNGGLVWVVKNSVSAKQLEILTQEV